jgi:two-component system response regulator YesN
VFALIYPQDFTPEPLEFARLVLRAIKTMLQHTVSVALSGVMPLRDAHRAHAEAAARLKQRLLFGGDRVFRQDPGQTAPAAQYPHELEARLSAAMRFGDLGQMKAVLRELILELNRRSLPPDWWQQIAFDILEQGYLAARQMSLTSATAMELMEKSREISLLTTWQDIQLWLEKSLGELAERIRALGAGPSLAVKKALSFIEGHFREGIKLADMAEQVCLSPNYLSQQLKQQTGKSFLEHVSGWRIEEAKRLLAGSLASVSEVAFQVGYENPRYFSEVFQRHCGMTPSQFRKAPLTVEKPTNS